MFVTKKYSNNLQLSENPITMNPPVYRCIVQRLVVKLSDVKLQ